MSHLDPERLAMIAFESEATDAEQDHLAACDECALELAQLEHTVAVGRSTLTLGEVETPPERVWEAILRDVRAAPSDAAAGVDADPPSPVADVGPAPDEQPDTVAAGAAPRRRRVSPLLWTLAASVAAVLVVVGAWGLLRPPASIEIASATLAAFPDHPGAAGEALVTESPDGRRTVTVSLDADAGDGFREVWLITADASALVSLGELDGREGTFEVPDDVDLRDYVLVDVSQEPRDGDPAHSGDSIVRGELDFS